MCGPHWPFCVFMSSFYMCFGHRRFLSPRNRRIGKGAQNRHSHLQFCKHQPAPRTFHTRKQFHACVLSFFSKNLLHSHRSCLTRNVPGLTAILFHILTAHFPYISPSHGSIHCDPHPGGQVGRLTEQSPTTLLRGSTWRRQWLNLHPRFVLVFSWSCS